MVTMEVLNPMDNESLLPQIVREAYPVLVGDKVRYVGRFTPKIPAVPDRIYDVYNDTTNGRLLTHVTADYPDPIHDSDELRGISEDAYTFKNILAPNSVDGTINIVDNDDFEEEFFVKDGNTYHYIANTESHSDK
jgi:hypothetical protein